MREETPPRSWRTDALCAEREPALIRPMTASASLKSILPLKKARRVNSPGSAHLAPQANTARSAADAHMRPPCS